MGSSKSFEKRLMSHFQTDRSGTLAARDFLCAVSGLAQVFVVTREFFSRGFAARPKIFRPVADTGASRRAQEKKSACFDFF